VIEQELRERIDRLLDDETMPDWMDVAARSPAFDERMRGRVRRAEPARAASLLAAAVAGAAIAAVPALAFSTQARELLGLKRPGYAVGVSPQARPGPALEARVTGTVVHHYRGANMITIAFTVGEPGKQPGSGIPDRSVFMISLVPKRRTPTDLIRAHGDKGRYVATTVVPDGGIAAVEIGGWLNRLGVPTAASGFWVPVVVVNDRF
jgi:hypothetical protein